MKQIQLIIILLSFTMNIYGQHAQYPTSEFKSTSSMIYSQYTTQPITIYQIGATSPYQNSCPRKSGAGGYNPGYEPVDPFIPSTPIGDGITQLLLFNIIYIIFKQTKKIRC